MNRRPETFGELLSRIAPAPPPGAFACQPVIASAVELSGVELGSVELGGDERPLGRPMWIVVHGITEGDVRLIHSRPIRAKHVRVHFNAPSGEILRIRLKVMTSRQQGDLFETVAGFVQLGQGVHTVGA